jgi:uncharacterized protein YqfA (UPF0365 family)
MTIDMILVIAVMILLFVLIFSSVYFVPILITRIRAKSLGLDLDFKQARILVKNRCVKKKFMIGLRDIWTIYPFDINKMTMHFLAGGDLQNLKNGLVEFKNRDKQSNEWFLTTFDLAKRDLVQEILKAEKNDWKYEL